MKKIEIFEVGGIRVLVVILQLLFLKVYTNYTSVYELGVFYFLFTLSYSLNAFLLVPLDYFQQSQVYKLKNNEFSLKSFFEINRAILKFTIILFLSGLVVSYFIDISMVKVIPIITVLALSTYFVNLIRGFVNNLERRRLAIYTLLVESVLKIGCYFLFKLYFEATSLLILMSLLTSSLISLVILFVFLRKIPEYKFDKVCSFKNKNIIKFSYPISVGAVINWIQLQGYRMILVPLGLVEVVGLYGTVANVGTSGMGAFSTIYAQLFVPNLYKSEGAYIYTYIRNALGIIALIALGSYFLSDIIIAILTKANFVQYSKLILYGVISEAGNMLIGGLTIFLTIKSATKITIKASIVGLVTFVISFFALYLFKNISVYTIGLPIVISQIIITLYLLFIVVNFKKTEINEK